MLRPIKPRYAVMAYAFKGALYVVGWVV